MSRGKRAILLALVLLAFVMLSLRVRAVTDTMYDENAVPPELEEYAENFGDSDTVAEAADRIEREFTLQKLANSALDSLRETFFSYLSYFTGLIFIVTVSGIFTAVKDKMKGGDIADSICGLCLCSYTIALVSPLCDNIETVCRELCAFMLAALPSVSAIYASSVGAATAAASHAGTVTALGVIQSAVTLIIIPGAKAVLMLSCASAMTRFMDMSGFCSFIKGAIMWVLGILASLISAVMYFQTSLSASADSLSARGLRFAAQRAIPIVGGVISESLRVVSESLRLVKSVCGITGIMTLVYFILPPIMLILIYRMFFSFSGAVSGMLGYKKGQGFLKEVGGVVNILLACVVAVAFIMIIILGIFIKCGVQNA